jgi:hypothetical protein
MGDAAGRQRAMAADGQLLLVLHQTPTPGSTERKGRFFWRNAQGEWRSSSLGDGPQALKRHLTEYADAVDELERQCQSAESAEDYFGLLRALAPLHRAVRHMHAALQQAREMVNDDRDIINARDRAGELERGLDLLHGDARNGLDFTVARQSEQQSQRMYEMAVAHHRLNMLAAIFFPIATFGAAFEILGHEAHELGKGFFWTTVALGVVCGLVLATAIVHRPAPPAPPKRAARPKRSVSEKGRPARKDKS